MFERIFLSLLCLFSFNSISLYAEENQFFHFGPESESEILITTQFQNDDRCVQQIYEIARYLEKHSPQMRITLAITAQDFSVLPKEFQLENPAGTTKLIESLTGSRYPAVILLLPTSLETTRIINGSQKNTTPRWLLETLCTFLDQYGSEYLLAQRRTPLYRLGWQEENTTLGQWLKAGFPAVGIEGNINIPQFIAHIEKTYPLGLPKDIDRHYLIFTIKEKHYFLGEETLVLIGVIASATMLFLVFFLGFLFGKKSEQNLRDFLHVWWIPFLFLAVNILSLFAGQGLSLFLFKLRFNNSNSWMLLPQIALIAKLIFSWFVIAIVTSLNQLIKLPEDDFIYGYMASLVCMVSIFIFSSIDFSLSLYFLSVYLIVYLSSNTKKTYFQLFAIIVMSLPALPYGVALLKADHNILLPLLRGNNFWNFNIAFFIMPYQLMLTRLYHISGRIGYKNKAHFPVNITIPLFGSIVISGIILFTPAWSKEKPLLIFIHQIINSSGSSIILDALTIPEGISPEFDLIENTIGYTPEELIPCTAEVRTFLERQLVSLYINPAVSPSRIEVTIKTDDGFSIYDASIPFTLSNAGNSAHFRTIENPVIPFIINFSTDVKTKLIAEIQVLSLTNPLGLKVTQEAVKTTYILDARRTFELPPPPTSAILKFMP